MKKIVFLLLSILFVSDIFAAEANLVLKAYKNNVSVQNPTSLYIVDAITTDPGHYKDNLGYLGDGNRRLDLTSDLSNLLGEENGDAETVVFSYRVESNESGRFRLNITSDGVFQNGESSVAFRWALKNVSFSTDGDAETGDYSAWEGLVHYPADEYTSGTQDGSTPLNNNWYVYNSNNDVWYKRGGVAILINRDQYNDAGYGEYSTTVTVTLTVG